MHSTQGTSEEDRRLSALAKYDILDTPSEEAFDRVTRLTARLFGVPMSTITFLDGHRQWFKSRHGVTACETERQPAFCRIAVEMGDPLVVADTMQDDRFRDNPFVLGEPFLRFYAGTQLRTKDGTAIGTLCAMDTRPRIFNAEDLRLLSDLAAIVVDELELRALIMRDDLTGALSRQTFRQEATRALALARRHGHSLSCVLFDLDHFKTINDENGHAVGDLVLKACLDVCRQELHGSDLVGRIGGEEFAVILPLTTSADAMQTAHRLREAFGRIYIPAKQGSLRISASFGVAGMHSATRDIDDLLANADEALYASKAAGRNTCSLWQPREQDLTGMLRRVFKAGRISFNAGNSTIDCTVRGLSDTGASLDVTSTAGIPQRFKLQIGSDNFSRLCHVAMMRDRQVQVEFA